MGLEAFVTDTRPPMKDLGSSTQGTSTNPGSPSIANVRQRVAHWREAL